MSQVRGIDIFEGNGKVDFDAVRHAGYKFVVSKATEGLTVTDGQFARNWRESGRAGLIRGAYHFARPQPGRDPKAEARHFVAVVNSAGGLKDTDLPLVLDIEGYGPQALSPKATHLWVKGFVVEILRLTGRKPIIYTGYFWRDNMQNPNDGFGCILWLAAYVKDPKPYTPIAWRRRGIGIWQFSETGTIPGVQGAVDLNTSDSALLAHLTRSNALVKLQQALAKVVAQIRSLQNQQKRIQKQISKQR